MNDVHGNPSQRTRLGDFEIIRELGRGGMGVVYLARDARLGRDVAIKALPEHLAQDPERLGRFEREAKTLAQLNHPNVAGIYGVEEHEGARFLVLEYVEGQTLAARLDAGALPVDEALEIAIQIASGVEAVHEAGVIHRDLKPGNVIVTPDGKAKVLDFGLARVDEVSSSPAAADANSPTLTSPATLSPTMPGVILGTAAYMSPEQARGRKVDKRTDIWSFGAILYEMLTGASPFIGETASDSIGAVLHKEIDFERLPPETPTAVQHALWRCLQRSRDVRYRDIGDARIEIQMAAERAVAPWATRGPVAMKHTARTAGLVAAAVAITAMVTWGFAWLGVGESTARFPGAAHLTIDLGEDFEVPKRLTPLLSADGRRLVLNAIWNEQSWVVVRDFGDPTARVIPNTRLGGARAISPDGRWVCFEADGLYSKVPVDGGPAIPIVAVPSARGCTWAKDGTIILSPGRFGPLHRVSDNGGEPEPIYEMEEATRWSDRTPALLPGGKGVLFDRTYDGASWDDCSVMVVQLEGGEPRQLVRGARFGRYLHTGHLIYQRTDTLMAVAFDLERLEVTSRETPVLRGLASASTGGGGPPSFDLAINGTLVYLSGWASTRRQDRKLELLSLEGQWAPLSDRTGPFQGIWPSPDGRFIAAETTDSTGDRWRIEILELERNLLRPVTDTSDRTVFGVAWRPDGQAIVYGRGLGPSGTELCLYRVGSAAEAEVLVESDQFMMPDDWTSDGRTLIASQLRQTSAFDPDLLLYRFDEQGRLKSSEPEVFIDWPGIQFRASFSPDDKWVLFRSADSQAGNQMYVAALDDANRSAQISVDGGRFGCWDPKQDRIYYVDDRAVRKTIFAVDFKVSDTGEFIPGAPKPLFDLTGVDDLDTLPMTADGSAFIIARPIGDVDKRKPPEIRVVLNWAEAIEDLLPKSEQ